MGKLQRSAIYKGFKKDLMEKYGVQMAEAIWKVADERLQELEAAYPELSRDSKMMILPAAAIYQALQENVEEELLEEAFQLLKDYGTKLGTKIAECIHAFTSIPVLSAMLWKNAPALMRKMSSEEAGYTREIVSENSELVGVDILSCPLHDAAVKIGMPRVAQIVCAMDKAYMTGFKYIKYTRTTSVAEGDRCCDYRLSFDKSKK